MMKNNWIIGLPQGEREYKIGGVTYRVTSALAPRSSAVTMQERLEHSISSSFTPLTGTIPSAMMTSENVCSGCKTSCDV